MGSKCDLNVVLRSLYDSVSILISQIKAHLVKTIWHSTKRFELHMIQIQGVHECGTKGECGQIQLKDGDIFQVSTYKRTIELVVILWGNIIV